MTDEMYLQVIKETLYTESKIRKSSIFNVGSSPKDCKVQIGDLNEIDIVHTKNGIKIKCFYDKITKSNNSSPFYLDINMNEYDMWVKGCRAFAEEKEEVSLMDKIKSKSKAKKESDSKGW